MQQLTLLLMMILLCCLCVACCTVMLRLKCGGRRRVEQDEIDMAQIDANVDEETRMRNRRIAELRDARARGQQEQQAIRHMSHMSLVEQYQKLIPLFKYKKNDKTIDEFGTAECVICMEAFTS